MASVLLVAHYNLVSFWISIKLKKEPVPNIQSVSELIQNIFRVILYISTDSAGFQNNFCIDYENSISEKSECFSELTLNPKAIVKSGLADEHIFV